MAQYPLDALSKGSGFIVNQTGSAVIAARTLVYLTATGEWALADADVAAKMPVIGLCLDGFPGAGLKGRVLLQGLLNYNGWTWTPGGAIYASTTAGGLTQTAPTALDEIVQRVGVAVEPTLIYFDAKLDNSEAGMSVKKTQFFVASDDDNLTNVPGKSITNTQTAYIGVHFPEGLTTLVGFNIYVIPQATQANADWDVATTYGAEGEAYNTHGETDNTTTYNVTNLQWFEIDAFALGMFASAVEEDTGGISVTVSTAGHDLTVVMAEMYYLGN